MITPRAELDALMAAETLRLGRELRLCRDRYPRGDTSGKRGWFRFFDAKLEAVHWRLWRRSGGVQTGIDYLLRVPQIREMGRDAVAAELRRARRELAVNAAAGEGL